MNRWLNSVNYLLDSLSDHGLAKNPSLRVRSKENPIPDPIPNPENPDKSPMCELKTSSVAKIREDKLGSTRVCGPRMLLSDTFM